MSKSLKQFPRNKKNFTRSSFRKKKYAIYKKKHIRGGTDSSVEKKSLIKIIIDWFLKVLGRKRDNPAPVPSVSHNTQQQMEKIAESVASLGNNTSDEIFFGNNIISDDKTNDENGIRDNNKENKDHEENVKDNKFLDQIEKTFPKDNVPTDLNKFHNQITDFYDTFITFIKLAVPNKFVFLSGSCRLINNRIISYQKHNNYENILAFDFKTTIFVESFQHFEVVFRDSSSVNFSLVPHAEKDLIYFAKSNYNFFKTEMNAEKHYPFKTYINEIQIFSKELLKSFNEKTNLKIETKNNINEILLNKFSNFVEFKNKKNLPNHEYIIYFYAIFIFYENILNIIGEKIPIDNINLDDISNITDKVDKCILFFKKNLIHRNIFF
jgi:hypothetical protein